MILLHIIDRSFVSYTDHKHQIGKYALENYEERQGKMDGKCDLVTDCSGQLKKQAKIHVKWQCH